ncbi:SH2 domain-containing protein 1A-like [Betta splendens]|uniref:SH2 domain-containing protein 1A-like n=1 Tax=Betta splendens TaxID=158456 RepID=A0A6P7L1T8_BETSP|nr:SH2 domain-containing protein 1A-like [Betta splendens]
MGGCHRGCMEQEGRPVQAFYYGRIGSKATETLLERFGRDGSFLLRDSETLPGAFCLCVRKAPFVHTYRLVHSAEGWSLQVPGVRMNSFRSLEALIGSCRRPSPGLNIVSLTEPLDKTQLQYISTGQELVYMEMSSSSSVC